MAQLINCPDCDKQLQVPDDQLGKLVQCPECKHAFTAAVPEREPEPPPPTPKAKPRSEQEERPWNAFGQKPQKVQTIAALGLIGGIFAILLAIGGGATGFCCFWPGTYYSLVFGILAIIRASALLGNKASLEKPPVGLAIMHIINIINGDVVNLTIGIIMLIFCKDEEVQRYLAK